MVHVVTSRLISSSYSNFHPIVIVAESKINRARTASNESGIHISEIAKGVSGQGFSEGDVRNSINHLSNEGHIYSTIDEHHYQYAM